MSKCVIFIKEMYLDFRVRVLVQDQYQHMPSDSQS